jgi:hypothetical protein
MVSFWVHHCTCKTAVSCLPSLLKLLRILRQAIHLKVVFLNIDLTLHAF